MLTSLALRYVAERERKGQISKETAVGIRITLLDFAASTQAAADRVTTRQIDAWIERARTAGTQRLRLSRLRCFFRWCVTNGHARRDPTLGVEPRRAPRAAPRKLTMKGAVSVVQSAPDARAQLIVILMLQEGLRRIEVSRMEVGDVDDITRIMAVRGKGGGGRVTRDEPMSDETCGALRRYMDEHPAPAGPLVRSYSRPNRSLTPGHIGSIITAVMYETGVKQRPWDGKAPHALRHTMAAHMVDQGATILEVQHALGHELISSTQHYLRGVTPDLRKAMGGRSYLSLPPAS